MCCILICLLFCSCNNKERERRYQQYVAEIERQKIEFEEKMSQRKIESHTNYIKFLKEQMIYPNCFFIGYEKNENKYILIITVEDNYPIINVIDILNGEIIIKNKVKLDKISNFLDYGKYQFYFEAKNNSIKFVNDEFYLLKYDGESYNIIKYNGKTIPEEVLIFSSDNQKQYVGEFVFNDYKIISQENYEIDKLSFKERPNIIISLNQDGYLVAKNIRGDADIEFKICDEEKIILGSYGDGTVMGYRDVWSFINKNIIEHEHYYFLIEDIKSSNGKITEKITEINYIEEYVRK